MDKQDKPGLTRSHDGEPPRPGRTSPDDAEFVTVRFGNVTVTSAKPSAEEVAANVRRSTEALERVVDRLCKGGITLRPSKGVPLYSLDRDNPEIVIR
ncbi:MAG: hypothetical protein VW935_14750, partial [Novosphingobium sp.]